MRYGSSLESLRLLGRDMKRTRSFTNGMACTASAPALPTTCQLPLVLTLPAGNARGHFIYVSSTVEELL